MSAGQPLRGPLSSVSSKSKYGESENLHTIFAELLSGAWIRQDVLDDLVPGQGVIAGKDSVVDIANNCVVNTDQGLELQRSSLMCTAYFAEGPSHQGFDVVLGSRVWIWSPLCAMSSQVWPAEELVSKTVAA